MSRLEMVTLLCMGDKTHSQLMELMPERCGTTQNRDFESVLADVSLLIDRVSFMLHYFNLLNVFLLRTTILHQFYYMSFKY